MTAIIGGIVVSVLGGSRHQIAGPAGAFIVLVASTVAQFGMAGLAAATLLSGLMLVAVGLLRAGRFIRYVPYPVTIGFTAGIGCIILASQLKPFLGLTLTTPEPGPLLDKLPVLWSALDTFNLGAAGIGVGVVALIWVLNHYAPRLPALLIAIVIPSIAVAVLKLPVATIGSEFGGLPRGLPMPQLPDLGLVWAVLPNAIAFTLLGAIESLLSATVADGMSGRRHHPDTELVAQGLANVASSLFGGLPVTGTIARTATNVRAGAKTPISGIIHSLVLLAFILLFGQWVALIPLAALAGLLTWVSLHMIGLRQVIGFVRQSRAEALVLLTTLGLTIFRDLTEGIVVGVALSALIIAHRLGRDMVVLADEPAPDAVDTPDQVKIHVSGAFFFGSAPMVEQVLERIGARPKVISFDLSEVTFMDTSAAQLMVQAIARAGKLSQRVVVEGANPNILKALKASGYSSG